MTCWFSVRNINREIRNEPRDPLKENDQGLFHSPLSTSRMTMKGLHNWGSHKQAMCSAIEQKPALRAPCFQVSSAVASFHCDWHLQTIDGSVFLLRAFARSLKGKLNRKPQFQAPPQKKRKQTSPNRHSLVESNIDRNPSKNIHGQFDPVVSRTGWARQTESTSQMGMGQN